MMNKQEKFNIQKFVIDFFREIGAIVDEKSFALVEVLIPEEYTTKFNQEIMIFAFDPEVAEEENVPFITIGSPILENILDFILDKQMVIRRNITYDNLSLPESALNTIKNNYIFNKCRHPVLHDSINEEHHFLTFLFQLTITSDEQENMLMPVTIDLSRNRYEPEIGVALQRTHFKNEKAEIYPVPTLISLDKAFKTAKDAILVVANKEREKFEKQLGEYKNEELNQLKSFYDKTEMELKKRLVKEEERITTDIEKNQKRVKSLEQKIEANQRDRQRRINDIIEKYTSEVEIKLSSLIYYTLPRIRVILSLQQKQTFHHLELLYNPLLYKFENPICSGCGNIFSDIFFKNGQAVCSQCMLDSTNS